MPLLEILMAMASWFKEMVVCFQAKPESRFALVPRRVRRKSEATSMHLVMPHC